MGGDTRKDNAQYRLIERAIRLLAEQRGDAPGLEELGRELGVSPFHLQRVFKRWAGVSPKQLAGVLTMEHARARLLDEASVLDATYDAGLSSPSRLHDLFVRVVAATPGEFRSGGAGLQVRHGWGPSPFGDCFLAWTDRGICFLAFEDGPRTRPLEEFAHDWPAAQLQEDTAGARERTGRLFGGGGSEVGLHLKGTNFQLQVWRALLAIPDGSVTTYSRLAAGMGRPKAARAVAAAVARNPVSWLIPCHRVIRETGEFWKYRWGADRKRSMLAYEALTDPTRSSGRA